MLTNTQYKSWPTQSDMQIYAVCWEMLIIVILGNKTFHQSVSLSLFLHLLPVPIINLRLKSQTWRTSSASHLGFFSLVFCNALSDFLGADSGWSKEKLHSKEKPEHLHRFHHEHKFLPDVAVSVQRLLYDVSSWLMAELQNLNFDLAGDAAGYLLLWHCLRNALRDHIFNSHSLSWN